MYFNRRSITHEHRKMYKVGKNWVIGSIVTIGLLTGLSVGQPVTASAASEQNPPVEQADDIDENPAGDSLAIQNEPVDSDSKEPGDSATTPSASLADTYTDAQKQVDAANVKAQAVNDSLAKLQSLLNATDLTAQANWQETIRAALTEYQSNVSAFGETNSQTQALITAYQAKINETIKDSPNAVKQVTDAETISDNLVDYQKLTANLQKDVTAQVQTVQTNLANYVVSDQVNQASETLTGAATQLNKGLENPELTSTDLIKLKATYDLALTAYNTAVVAYNDKTGEAMAVISADKNPKITQKLADLQVLETYSQAVAKYEDFQAKAKVYQDAVSDWQTAVNKYNETLGSLTMSPMASETELQTSREAVEKAAALMAGVQADYSDVVQDPQNNDIISAYLNTYKSYLSAVAAKSSAKTDYDNSQTNLEQLKENLALTQAAGADTTYWEDKIAKKLPSVASNKDRFDAATQVVAAAETTMQEPKAVFDDLAKREDLVIKNFNEALGDLTTKLAVWQKAYTAYETAVTQPVSSESIASDFKALATTVLQTQAAVQAALSAMTNSQADYQATLTAYQTALDKSGRTTVKTTDGVLPDLAVLQTDLSQKIEENSAVLAATPKLLAVIGTQTALQQRINQINQIVLAINSDQAMLKNIYKTAYDGNIWTVLTDSFQTIGTDLASKAVDYQLAINGDDQVASYAKLIATLTTANADYGITDDAYTYPANDDVTTQYSNFGKNWTSFETVYQEFLDFLAKSAPTEENNATVVARMKDGDYLSTNGAYSATEDDEFERGGSSVNIDTRYAQGLDNFLGKSVKDWQLTSDVQSTRSNFVAFYIDSTDTEEETSTTGAKYLTVNEAKKAELAELLQGMVLPFYEKDGTVYHLTAFAVPGLGRDGHGEPRLDNIQDVYTFTSFDPVGEVMAMFTGMNYNTQTNTTFYFLYTASPQLGVDDLTNLAVETTLPSLKPFDKEVLESPGSWTKGALDTLGTLTTPAPNKAIERGSDVSGKFAGGEKKIDNAFNLSAKQAPLISLNHVTEASTNTPGTVDPETTDPGNESPEPGGNQVPGTNPGQPTPLPTDSNNPDGVDHPGQTNERNPADKSAKASVAMDSEDKFKALANRQEVADQAQDREHRTNATLPQTDGQSQGFLALIGSLLLTLLGVSVIGRRKL
ncbi:KxYKxGKxW signal peptide domain-containing protein [Levilactobacillus yonginensis]|uniref:KxYKxGKxW signal peptide domain-containing protein n=1 Tax=Levilactobacillus yonginensis TaxID=1054041 RepID=UPI00345DC46A